MTSGIPQKENHNTVRSICPILKQEESNDSSSSLLSNNDEGENPWKTNEALRPPVLSKNKDELHDDNNGEGLNNKGNNVSSLAFDDTPSKHNGLLFQPLSKVVEPINQENSEEIRTTTRINVTSDPNARETCRGASDLTMTKQHNKYETFVYENGVNSKHLKGKRFLVLFS